MYVQASAAKVDKGQHIHLSSLCSHCCLYSVDTDDPRLNTLVHEGDALHNFV